jgi:hypothetical protein
MSSYSTKNILAALKDNRSDGLLSDIASPQNIKSYALKTNSDANQDQQGDGTKFSAPALTLKPPTPKEIKKLEELNNKLQHSQKKDKDKTNDDQITMINIMEDVQKIIIEYITAKGKTAKLEVINKPKPNGGIDNVKAAGSSSFFNRKENSLSLAAKVGFFRNNKKPRMATTTKELLTELQNKFANEGCIVRLIPLKKGVHSENHKMPALIGKSNSVQHAKELENTNSNKPAQHTQSSQSSISPTPFLMVMLPRAA